MAGAAGVYAAIFQAIGKGVYGGIEAVGTRKARDEARGLAEITRGDERKKDLDRQRLHKRGQALTERKLGHQRFLNKEKTKDEQVDMMEATNLMNKQALTGASDTMLSGYMGDMAHQQHKLGRFRR